MVRALGLFLLFYAPPLFAQAAEESYVMLYEEVEQKPRMLKGGPVFFPADSAARPGKVTLELVVDTTGLVVPGTIRVTATPDPRFTAAAKAMVSGATYRPGKFRGVLVRVLMRQDLTFKPIALACDSTVTLDGTRLCVASSKP